MALKILVRGSRILASLILLQTLFFKFTAHPESVELFSSIGMEPGGRIAIGIIELITGLLLLFGGKYHRVGALLGLGTMLGAIYFHLTIIGIDSLFWMAVATLVMCVFIIRNQRKSLMHMCRKFCRY